MKKVGKKIIKLSVNSAFSFLDIGSQLKTENWGKFIIKYVTASSTYLTSSKDLLTLLEYTCLLQYLVRFSFGAW